MSTRATTVPVLPTRRSLDMSEIIVALVLVLIAAILLLVARGVERL